MAAASGARRSGRTNPAIGRINKTPTGPRFTLPNDARLHEQPTQPTQPSRQTTETLQPVNKDVEMEDEGPQRRVADGPRELVPTRPPKISPPIPAIKGEERFSINKALDQEVTLSLKQLLDMSQTVRKEMAFALQSSAPRYRRKKVPKATQSAVGAVGQLATAVQPPIVSTKAHQDDNKASLFFVTAWIDKLPIKNTMVDGGAMVDLISSNVVSQLPDTPIRRDDSMKIILANDKRMTLDAYVVVYVNVAGVMAAVKASVMPDAQGYGMLLGLRWLRRVRSSIEYGSKAITISGTDNVRRQVSIREVPEGVRMQAPRGIDDGVEADDESSDVEGMLQKIVKEDETATSDDGVKGGR